ncbi:MAG: YaaA family protein, partial [Nocardioidaceae bacterium]
ARHVLGLPPGLAGEVDRDASLPDAPTATASRIYTGVLYDALGIGTLTPSAKSRAARWLLTTSALFGLVRPGDRIPAYRLAGDVTLPGLGTVGSLWRQPLAEVLEAEANSRLVVDLRSGMYAGFWRPSKAAGRGVVGLRVLQEADGRRTVVSHFNKATKGRIVRELLESGAKPRSPAGLADHLSGLGWQVEPTPAKPNAYDVVVREL